MTLPRAIFALGVVLAASTDYDPQQLIIEWQDRTVARIAATSPATCAAAMRAIEGGLWQPAEPGATIKTVHCEPGNLFAPGSQYINGFNQPGGRR